MTFSGPVSPLGSAPVGQGKILPAGLDLWIPAWSENVASSGKTPPGRQEAVVPPPILSQFRLIFARMNPKYLMEAVVSPFNGPAVPGLGTAGLFLAERASGQSCLRRPRQIGRARAVSDKDGFSGRVRLGDRLHVLKTEGRGSHQSARA